MFNFFKKKKTAPISEGQQQKQIIPVKLYEDLSPGDRIRKLFEDFVEKELSEKGFKLLKSDICFKRKVGDFTQEISVSRSKWNSSNIVVNFWINICVKADAYSKWHKLRYGAEEPNHYVRCYYHYWLQEWKKKFTYYKYDLAKQDNVEVFNEIKENLLSIGLQILDNYSDYERAADLLLQERQYGFATKIIDFYLLAGNNKKAQSAYEFLYKYFIEDENETRPDIIQGILERGKRL